MVNFGIQWASTKTLRNGLESGKIACPILSFKKYWSVIPLAWTIRKERNKRCFEGSHHIRSCILQFKCIHYAPRP